MHWTELEPGDDHLRANIRAELEKRTGRGISVRDPLPDELIAMVQELQPEGCTLSTLLIFIYEDHGEEGITAPVFKQWYRGFEAMREGFRALRLAARP